MTKFWKYQGTGNDFILVCGTDAAADAEFARRVCDRHFGIGADGVLHITEGEGADIGMRIINPDGSEAEMCGNGIRFAAKHAYDNGMVRGTEFTVRTMRGILDIKIIPENGKARTVEVNMGAPVLDCALIPMTAKGRFIDSDVDAGDIKVKGTAVSMGNPHLVIFDDMEDSEKDRLGPLLGRSPLFPNGVNVGFASVSGGKISLRVHERGAGWTLACGTGACAAAVAAALNGLVPHDAATDVKLPGGWLKVTVEKGPGSVTMTGPAELVYTGEIRTEASYEI